MDNDGSACRGTVTNCVFKRNFGSDGGGIANEYGAIPTIAAALFTENSSSAGGGIFNYSSSPLIRELPFPAKTMPIPAAAIDNIQGSAPSIINCVMWGNRAGDKAAQSTTKAPRPCSKTAPVVQNVAAGSFGGMYTSSSSGNPTVANCIFYFDSPNEVN